MSFFSKLISFGKKSLINSVEQTNQADNKKITFDNEGRAYIFGKLIIDGKVGYEKSDGVFYGKETEDAEPAYYLKTNGKKANINELIGIDTGIWLSVSMLKLSPFTKKTKEKNIGLDTREDLDKIINAYQDLTNLSGASNITLEEYTKLKRELSEYFKTNSQKVTQVKSAKIQQAKTSPRISKSPITKKYEVIQVPNNTTKENFERQYYDGLKREVERQKREHTAMEFIMGGDTFGDGRTFGLPEKSARFKLDNPEKTHTDLLKH